MSRRFKNHVIMPDTASLGVIGLCQTFVLQRQYVLNDQVECLTDMSCSRTCIDDATCVPSLCLEACCEGGGVGKEESIERRSMPAESALLLVLPGVLVPLMLLCGVLY